MTATGVALAGANLGSPARPGSAARTGGAARAGRTAGPAAGGQAGAAGSQAATAPVAATGSSCTSVTHIGDSTSEGMVSADYLPRRSQRLHAQYQRVGARVEHLDISGARSIVETLPGQRNAHQVVTKLIRTGYRGCWVLALGTNDTADVVVGSAVSRPARIRAMMSAVHGQPVMWVNVISLLSSGSYAEHHMKQWNAALLRACARYPNMRVYDWASVAKRRWFISDGIHYTSAGYRARSRLIARALAQAFPRAAPSHPASCVVH
jgi:hypothetical protein